MKRTFTSDMIRMTHARNVGMQVFQRMLCVIGAHGHSLCNLLVDNNINLDTLFGLALQNAVEAPLFIVRRWSTKVKLGGEPPVLRTHI